MAPTLRGCYWVIRTGGRPPCLLHLPPEMRPGHVGELLLSPGACPPQPGQPPNTASWPTWHSGPCHTMGQSSAPHSESASREHPSPAAICSLAMSSCLWAGVRVQASRPGTPRPRLALLHLLMAGVDTGALPDPRPVPTAPHMSHQAQPCMWDVHRGVTWLQTQPRVPPRPPPSLKFPHLKRVLPPFP